MSDLVLVRYDTGDEYVITPRGRRFAEVNKLKVLDEPAVGRDGSIVAERRVPKSEGATKRTAKRTAKRPAKRASRRTTKTSAASATEKKAAKSANNNPPSKEN